MAAAQGPCRVYRLLRLLAVFAILGGALACEDSSTPPPPPLPTPKPTATISPEQVLADALYSISFDGTLLATEQLRLGQQEGQLLVFSEMRWWVDYPFTLRRTVLLTPALNPQHYDLELDALGGRSLWVGETREGKMDCLSNNLAWYAPVLAEGVAPAPEVLIEGSPSALPFALLALRYTELSADKKALPTSLSLHTLDVTEDLPVSRGLTLTVAPERKGAVIGTLALETQAEGGLNPRFTLWVRPESRTLYSVEVPEYRFGLWPALLHPALRKPGRLLIERVSKAPELRSAPSPGAAQRVAVSFDGADKTTRAGTLILPAGTGPFPCLVLHSAGGAVRRWDPGDAFAQRGYAVYCYDKRGLGESKGDYDRDLLNPLAQDALAAAAMLRQRPELDPQRIVFLGLDDGGLVGALAAAKGQGYAAAVLGSCASTGPLLPGQAEERIRTVLAPFYGWDAAQIGAYTGLTVQRWQEWLFQGQDEMALLRRRVSLRSLKERTTTDLSAILPQARGPVLLLQGDQDAWTSPAGAQALLGQLQGAGARNISLQVFAGLGHDLGTETHARALAPEVEDAVLAWLKQVLP
jgi:pimeloyl-ACP methyl ester carboxylesterase